MLGVTLAAWILIFVTWPVTGNLRLAAFNIQIFGKKKVENKFAMKYISKIVSRYDIILIQELRDADQTVIPKLVAQIKAEYNVTLEAKLSQREGRTENKEQYAFLYREDQGVSVSDVYTDNSSWTKLFERPPYVVRFCYENGNVNDFTLIGLHSKPTQAVEELQALPQVYSSVSQAWKTTDILILGDLNADCSYVNKKDWLEIPIRRDPRFKWPIVRGNDTTVETDCAYDRFIIGGKSLQAAVVEGTPGPFYFKSEYNLTLEQALEISDHYPIQLELEKQPAHKPTAKCSKHGARRKG